MSIHIVLSNNHVVTSNSYIEGKVVCVFNSNKEIRGIRLKLRGQEHTAWEKSESYYDDREKETKWRTVYYSGNNRFLDAVQTLRGSGVIGVGQHEFPFRFFLTKDLPSSYHGSHGSIRYYLKTNVDIPMQFDYKDERSFALFSPIDFNERSVQLNPFQYQDEENLCCCCCASDPITMTAYLDKEAFVLGEKIVVKLKVINMANTSIEYLRVEVKRTTEEKCTSPRNDYKTDTDIILSSGDSGVGAHGERDYVFELQIPQNLELPNFRRCALFSQWFTLKVEAIIPGCHSNMKIKTDIDLGHIPVAGQEMMNNPPPVVTTDLPSYAGLPPAYPPPSPANNTANVGFNLPPNSSANISFPVPEFQPNLPPSYSSANTDMPGIHMPTPGVPYPPTAPNGLGTTMPYPPNMNGPPVTGMPYPPNMNAAPSGTNMPYPPNMNAAPPGTSMPYPPGTPNAPSDASAPSAPTKEDLANGDDFVVLNNSNSANEGPAPPSYHDAVRKM